MKRPRIGFDAQSLTGDRQTGLGVYARGIARAIERHNTEIELRLIWPKDRKPFRRTLERIYWEQINLPAKAKSENVDLIHSPCFASPKFTRLPRVVTAHDLIVLKYPRLMPPGSRFYFSKMIPSSYRYADHIIAVSECTKRDLVDLLGIDPLKITVIHHGIDPIYLRRPDTPEIVRVREIYNLPNEFFLMVGSFEPRKNIELVIDAFSQIAAEDEFCELLLIGKNNQYREKMIKVAEEKGQGSRIRFPGYVPDRDLATIYSLATAYLFPSSAEGFGLPLLEAMSAGAPVICSDLDVFREVAGDAAVRVNVGEKEELVSAMEKMLLNKAHRQKYIDDGLSRVAEFTWEKAADSTIRVYLDTIKSRK